MEKPQTIETDAPIVKWGNLVLTAIGVMVAAIGLLLTIFCFAYAQIKDGNERLAKVENSVANSRLPELNDRLTKIEVNVDFLRREWERERPAPRR